MNNPVREMIIAIKSLFDPKGTAEAQKQLDATGKSAEESGKKAEASGKRFEDAGRKTADKTKEASKGAAQFGQASGRAAEMVGSLSGAMGMNGQAAAQMGAGLRVIKSLIEGSTGGLMGLATVLAGFGVSAYVSYRNKVEESKKTLAEFAAQIEANKRAQDAAGVDRLAGQYDVLRKAIDDASSAQDRLIQARASADNAAKAADLAELSLREKEAMANTDADPALKRRNPEAADKLEALNKANVTNQFAGERRAIEEKYAIMDAERTAQSKSQALADAERKQNITEQLDIPKAKEEMQKFEDNIRKANEALADLYGVGAPMKRVRDESNLGAAMAGTPVYKMVVDEEEQTKQAAKIREKIGNAKYEKGQLVGSGDEFDLQSAAAVLASHIDRLAKEKVESQALRIEAEAAVRQYDTANLIVPEVNKAENEAAGRGLARQGREASLSLFHGEIESGVSEAENWAQASKFASDAYDPLKMKFTNQADRARAKKEDHSLAKTATESQQLLTKMRQFEETIKTIPFDAMTRQFDFYQREFSNMKRSLQQLEQRAKNAEERSRRQ